MNATETRFEKCVLERRPKSRDVIWWEYEAIRFRYGQDNKATYTPDFLVLRADGLIEVIDVKGSGGWEAATRVKFKACAEKYPEFNHLYFVLVVDVIRYAQSLRRFGVKIPKTFRSKLWTRDEFRTNF